MSINLKGMPFNSSPSSFVAHEDPQEPGSTEIGGHGRNADHEAELRAAQAQQEAERAQQIAEARAEKEMQARARYETLQARRQQQLQMEYARRQVSERSYTMFLVCLLGALGYAMYTVRKSACCTI